VGVEDKSSVGLIQATRFKFTVFRATIRASLEHAPEHLEYGRIPLGEIQPSDFLSGEHDGGTQLGMGTLKIGNGI
jgi:hypothetical protein